jgi:hypothetical protein
VYTSSHVNDPESVGYETEWRFQLLMFAIVRLPFLLVALGLLMFWLKRRHQN